MHRISAEWGVWEVMGDGTLREADPYALKRREASLSVLSGTRRYEVAITSCNLPSGAGTHTWLVRARVATKQTTDNSDPNPYFAKVDRMMTVTCP